MRWTGMSWNSIAFTILSEYQSKYGEMIKMRMNNNRHGIIQSEINLKEKTLNQLY